MHRREVEAVVLEDALAAAGIGVWEWDLDSNTLHWSEEQYALLGIEPMQPPSFEAWHSVLHEADRSRLVEYTERLRTNPRQRCEVEFRILSRGTERWIAATGRFEPAQGHRGARLVGVNMDVTDRKRADAALAASRDALHAQYAELEAIYSSAPIGLCVLDRQLRFVRINERLADINGVPAADHVGRTLREVIPELADTFEAVGRRILETGEPLLDFEVIGETRARPGEQRLWSESWYPVRSPTGEVAGINIVATEVTDQRRAERALQASDERFRVAQDSSPVAFTILRAVRDESAHVVDFEWVYANGAAAEILQRPIESLIGRRLLDVLPGNGGPGGLFEAYVRVADTGLSHKMEIAYESDGICGAFLNVASKLDDGVAVWFMDVSARERATHEIARQREELQTILDLMPVGIAIAHDPRGDRISVTPRLAEMLGLGPEQNPSLTGPSSDQLPYRCTRNGVEIEAADMPMQVALRTAREVRDLEFDVELTNGRVLHLMVNAAPLFDAHGHVRGAIGAHVDVTVLKTIQRELEAADRQKDEFLATLAHELRNPMAPIRYASATLRAGVHPEVVENARAVIERQAAQMSRLLDDLLDMSRVTRNVIELQWETIDLRALLQEAVDTARPSVQAVHHTLTVRPSAHPVWVLGDKTRLLQVIGNLLSNAVKYTPPGGHIEVALDATKDGARLVVKDTGVGLAPEMLPRLFKLFAQVHTTLAASRGGLGIGLAVSKRLVELHGGSIEVVSEGLGRGAQFSVQFPRADRGVTEVGRETGQVVHVFDDGADVLVVDDNEDSAHSLAVLLRQYGVRVRVAHDGAAALRVAEEMHPDLIVLDLGLPDMSGTDVATEIRRRTWSRRCRIVAVTGWGQPDDRARTRAAGCDEHLVKPVDPDDLLARIRSLSADRRRNRNASGASA